MSGLIHMIRNGTVRVAGVMIEVGRMLVMSLLYCFTKESVTTCYIQIERKLKKYSEKGEG